MEYGLAPLLYWQARNASICQKLAVCGACTRRKPYKTAALSEVFSSLVSVPFYPERERVFVCTSTTGGELVSLRIFSKPANLS